MNDLVFDVAVIGGSLGGVQAALSAAKDGKTVYLCEETDWVGGQLTSQAVPPDEHPWIESCGCTRSYRAYRNAVREHYRSHPQAAAPLRDGRPVRPGNAWVSAIAHEPAVAHRILTELLAPYLKSGRITLHLHTRAVSAVVQGRRIESVRVERTALHRFEDVRARYFLDATDCGDLLPIVGARCRTGAESPPGDGRAARARQGPARRHAALHMGRGAGAVARQAGRTHVEAGNRYTYRRAGAVRGRPASELVRPGRGDRAGDPLCHVRRGRPRALRRPVAVPPHHRARGVHRRPPGRDAVQLAAERLRLRQSLRRPGRRGPPRTGAAADAVRGVLAAVRRAPPGRRLRISRAAAAGHHGNRLGACEGAVHPGVPAHLRAPHRVRTGDLARVRAGHPAPARFGGHRATTPSTSTPPPGRTHFSTLPRGRSRSRCRP